MDVWRDFHPLERKYSHYSAPHGVYSRIDYFFMYNKDRHRVKDCTIGTSDISDHAVICLILNLNDKFMDKIWRLNTSILGNANVVDQIRSEISIYLENNDNGEVSPPILWDAAKAVLRGKIISIATALKKARELRFKNLEDELQCLTEQHAISNDSQILKQIKDIKNKINEIYKDDIEKKLKFLKQTFYETGVKATKRLAWKLRKQQHKATINKIQDPVSGRMLYNLDKIKKAFELYYKSLYSQQTQVNNDSIKTFLDSLDLPSIGQKQNNLLVKEITQEELDKALNNLKNNKMPGNDGLPSEWFKTFRREISPLLISSFNWTLKKAATPPSWREAIISIIPKEGKDKTLCSSYRPVSVLNVDYKLFASILAKRLETFLPDLIDSDQTGFIRGRQTFDNIRRTLHIIQQIKKDHIKATLVSLDAEKAFDCVNWLYLFQVLLRFGFSENSIRIFQSLYFKPEARIKINGGLTKKINLERGT